MTFGKPLQTHYQPFEWLWMKIPFIALVLLIGYVEFGKYHGQPYPEGICKLFDCSIIALSPFNYIIAGALVALAVLYVMEYWMLGVTFLLSVLLVVILSLERSNGVYHRVEIISTVMIGQFLAYLLFYLKQRNYLTLPDYFNVDARTLAIRHSQQLLAASYIIAGITKLQVAGIDWVIDSPNMGLQVLKSINYHYYDFGNGPFPTKGWAMAEWIYAHKNLVRFVMASSLLLELCCFVALFSRKSALVYGSLLLVFHIIILVMLKTLLFPFAFCALLFFINIPYWAVKGYRAKAKTPFQPT